MKCYLSPKKKCPHKKDSLDLPTHPTRTTQCDIKVYEK